MSLKQSAITGVKWTSYATIISAVLQVVQAVILARFLSSEDFGLMAIVMVVIGFAQAFLDMGISNAIIYKQDATHEQLSTLYWVNILSGFFLYLFIYLLSPLIASFYHNSSLVYMLRLIGIIFLIAPLGQQFFVLLEKELRFQELAKITIVSKIIVMTIIVYLAYVGFGVYALIYGVIVGEIIRTFFYIMSGRKFHRPSFIFLPHSIKEFLQFGLYQMGERSINYFNSQFDTILIGKLLGMDSLGIYTIAKELIMKPASIINPVLTRVAFPTMSKIQDDIPRLKNIYLKIINFIASINFPIYLIILLLAPEIVFVLFGDKWQKAVPIIQILAIFGAIRSTANPIGSLLLARGRADLGFLWNFGLFFFTPVSLYIYSHWGLNGISWGLVVNMLILQLPVYFILIKPLCGAEVKEYFLNIIKPALISIIIFLFIKFVFTIKLNIFIEIFVISCIVIIFSIILNYIFNNEFIKELKGLMK